jgi:alkane 1-monooxygenase
LEQATERGKQKLKMSDTRAPFLFAMASLLPAGCLLMAAFTGGIWPLAALLSITLLVLLMDRAGPGAEAVAGMSRWLPWAVGAAHFLTLAGTLWAVGSGSLDPGQKIALVIAMGLYAGQVSNACAHELIHRSDRASRALGTAIYCSILNGQHVSAHLLVHHVHAGTARDPNSAPLGRGFYRYALIAGVAEFKAGLAAETRRRAGQAAIHHPYVVYVSGALIAVASAYLLGGWLGAVVLAVIALHAQMQLFLSDYLQHYGLRRAGDANGKLEPMGPQHSWNAPQAYSAALMMNAPRHSDHHMHPGRPFTSLHLDQTMPILPYSVPVMGAIALIPPLWRHIMDPRAGAWNTSRAEPETGSYDHPPAQPTTAIFQK